MTGTMYKIYCEHCVVDAIRDLAFEHKCESAVALCNKLTVKIPLEEGYKPHSFPASPEFVGDCPLHLIDKGMELAEKYDEDGKPFLYLLERVT